MATGNGALDTGHTRNLVAEELGKHRAFLAGERPKPGSLRWLDLNRWTLQGSGDRGFDFGRMDLTGVCLTKANVRGTNFRGADLKLADFVDADCRGADFSGADMSGANLEGADLTDAVLDDAVLCPIDIGTESEQDLLEQRGAGSHSASMAGANATNARMIGTDLSDANLSGVDFSGAQLTGAVLDGATLAGARLENVTGVDVAALMALQNDQLRALLPELLEAHEAWLRGDGGQRLNINRWALDNADLSGRNLTQAMMRYCRFDGVSLEGALLVLADISGGSFVESDLTDASLDAVNARQCDFLRADLTRVSLKPATLAGQSVPARLTKCSMQETVFDGAKLQSVRFDETTVCTSTVKSMVAAGLPEIMARRLTIVGR